MAGADIENLCRYYKVFMLSDGFSDERICTDFFCAYGNSKHIFDVLIKSDVVGLGLRQKVLKDLLKKMTQRLLLP